MKLPDAIKYVFSELGIEYMLNTKFNYALLDYGAFEEYPSTRQIIRDVIVEGYTHKLYDMYKADNQQKGLLSSLFHSASPSSGWDIKVPVYITDFVKKTGYNDELVNYVFQSILYGMGYVGVVVTPILQMPKTVPLYKATDNATKAPVLNTPPPFTPNVETQFLVVNYSPDIATLYIDRVEQTAAYGKWADELIVGQHEIRVEASGYLTKTELIDVESKNKTCVNINLEIGGSSVSVVLKAETKDTEIWLDNNLKAKGEWNGLLDKGDHSVICRRTGCYDYIGNISVDENTASPIVLPALKHITGTLKVNVTPYGSKVWLDGKEVGESPLILKDVDAGVSYIKVKSTEGAVIEEAINVGTNETVNYVRDFPSLYFTDYSKVKLGDYAYSDGTFSHEKTTDKTPIGFVCLLKTSKSDQQRGWKHGLIMSLKPAEMTETYTDRWGRTQSHLQTKFIWGHSSVKLPDEMFIKKEDLVNFLSGTGNLDSGFDICKQPLLNKKELFPLFYAVSNCENDIFPNSSGWYIPTMRQMLEVAKNMCGVTKDKQKYCPIENGIEFYGEKTELLKWTKNTCNISSEKEFWYIHFGLSEISCYGFISKEEQCECYPILSF